MYRIMSVEDDPMMQTLLKHTMASAGYDFFLSPDGGGAVKLASDERPDLIILDVNLPDISGHEVCASLKRDPVTAHIPVVMLTGDAKSVEQRVGGLEAGADDYLFKPISPRLLLSRIGAILKQKANR